MSFTPIETQEEFDKAISERLKRESEKFTAQIKSLEKERDILKESGTSLQSKVEELQEQKKKDDAKIDEQTKAINNYVAATERAEVAREYGLPRELEDRLKGEDKDAMRKDAEQLKKIFHAGNITPMKSTEDGQKGENLREANKKMLQLLKGDE